MGVDIRASILRHIFYGYGSSVVKMKESDKGLVAVVVFIAILYLSKSKSLSAAQRRYTDPVYARKGDFK